MHAHQTIEAFLGDLFGFFPEFGVGRPTGDKGVRRPCGSGATSPDEPVGVEVEIVGFRASMTGSSSGIKRMIDTAPLVVDAEIIG